MENKYLLVAQIRILLLLSITLQTNACLAQARSYQDPVNSIYQYSVPIENRAACLWIPPECKQVRGVIISLANLLERQWLEDPIVRKTAAQEGLGIIWVGPPDRSIKKDMVFTADMNSGAGKLLDKMLKDFANE